jgi:hypothetical protein
MFVRWITVVLVVWTFGRSGNIISATTSRRPLILLAEYGKVGSQSIAKSFKFHRFRMGISNVKGPTQNECAHLKDFYLIHHPDTIKWFLNLPCVRARDDLIVISITRLFHDLIISGIWENRFKSGLKCFSATCVVEAARDGIRRLFTTSTVCIR